MDERVGIRITTDATNTASVFKGLVGGPFTELNQATELLRKGFEILDDTLGELMRSAAAEEQQWIKLAGAIRSAHLDVKTTTATMQAMTDELELQTGVADTLISQGFGQMTRALIPLNDQYRYMQIALDVAATGQAELNETLTAFIKGGAGSEMFLKRLAAAFGIAAAEGMSFKDLIEAIGNATAGQAQQNMEGYDGQIRKLSVEWERFKEATGAMPVGVAASFFGVMNQGLEGMRYNLGGYDDSPLVIQIEAIKREIASLESTNGVWDALNLHILAVTNNPRLNDLIEKLDKLNDAQKKLGEQPTTTGPLPAGPTESISVTPTQYNIPGLDATNRMNQFGQAASYALGVGAEAAKSPLDQAVLQITQDLGPARDAFEDVQKQTDAMQAALGDTEGTRQLTDSINVAEGQMHTFAVTQEQSADAARQLDQRNKQAAQSISGVITPALAGIITRTRTASEAFRAMGQSILSAVIDKAVQSIAGMIIKQATAAAATTAEAGAHTVNTVAIAAETTATWALVAAKAALAAISGGTSIGIDSLFGMFDFDNPKNDAWALRSGGDMGRLFATGVRAGIAKVNASPILALPTGTAAAAGGGDIHVHLNGPGWNRITIKRDLIPVLNDFVAGQTTRMKSANSNLTGKTLNRSGA